MTCCRAKSSVQRQTESDEDDILQGKFAVAQRQDDLDDEDIAQTKSAPVQREAMMDDDDLLQGKFEGGAAQAGPVQRHEANRTGMPDQLKTGVEQLSGIAMDDVRVHYNSSQPAQLEALAYAQGTDIHVGPGQEQHLPHEAWHIAQQKQGRVQPTLQTKGVSINDDAGLEREADHMGAKAASGDFSPPAGGGAAQRKLGRGKIVQSKTVQAKTDPATTFCARRQRPARRPRRGALDAGNLAGAARLAVLSGGRPLRGADQC